VTHRGFWRFLRPTPCSLAGTSPLGWLTGHPTLVGVRPADLLACAFPSARGHPSVSELGRWPTCGCLQPGSPSETSMASRSPSSKDPGGPLITTGVSPGLRYSQPLAGCEHSGLAHRAFQLSLVPACGLPGLRLSLRLRSPFRFRTGPLANLRYLDQVSLPRLWQPPGPPSEGSQVTFRHH
jgi:hypothetical protein